MTITDSEGRGGGSPLLRSLNWKFKVFNERVARRSRSTSCFGCSFVGLSVWMSPLAHEQLRNNFKVQLRWLPLTESTQIFLCDSVRVSSTWVTTCHVPHMHVGTCTCRFMKACAQKRKKKLTSSIFIVEKTEAIVIAL